MADGANLLRDHVTLTWYCVDRFFWQGYVPKLQSVGQECRWVRPGVAGDDLATLLDVPYSPARPPTTCADCDTKASSNGSPDTHRYQLTPPLDRRLAVLFTKTHGQVLAPGLV